MSRRKSARGRPWKRVLIWLVTIAVLVFAVQGGEWGTFDLFRQQKRLVRLRRDVDSLRHDVDSLARYARALVSDPVLQEKIAREEFGMVRGDRELLYRFTVPDSADGLKRKRKP